MKTIGEPFGAGYKLIRLACVFAASVLKLFTLAANQQL
jgi:hypothetical protein